MAGVSLETAFPALSHGDEKLAADCLAIAISIERQGSLPCGRFMHSGHITNSTVTASGKKASSPRVAASPGMRITAHGSTPSEPRYRSVIGSRQPRRRPCRFHI